MSDDVNADALSRIDRAKELGRLISFCDETPDNQYPQVTWQIFGLIDSNEIAVIARCGDLRLAAIDQSGLLIPPMVDRKFGIDVIDEQLAMQLSDRLWSEHSEQLISKATQQS